jgi:L-lactate permease
LVAVLVAVIVYSMPVGQAGDSAVEGAVFGFWPIMWIVINALWIFNMTEASGHFEVLKRAFASVSDDLRVGVVVIAFCFGALLEALAGFGTPVAICGIMLVGLGGRGRWALGAPFAPYIIIVVVLGVTSLSPVQSALDKATSVFSWPGLHVLSSKGKAPTSETFKWTWLIAAGTWLFVSGVLTALVLPVRPGVLGRVP